MKYKVYEVDEKATSTGKKLKRMVLQREGAQYPTKNVTIWEDHPDFAGVAAGKEFNWDLMEKDSGTPNPNAPGKNYVDRTVSKFPPKEGGNLEERVKKLEDKVFGLAPTPVDFKKADEEVAPDDIPF